MIARSRSLPLMVSAAAAEGRDRQTRDTRRYRVSRARGDPDRRRPRRRQSRARRATGVTTRRHSGLRGSGATDCRPDWRREARGLAPARTAPWRCRPRDAGDPCETTLQQRRESAAASSDGSAAQSGSMRQHARERVGDVLAVERTRCPSASRTARSRTPRCRCACPPARPFACSGAM